MSKPYKSWEFCKHINCYAMSFGKSFRVKTICIRCPAYQMHQYLKEHEQILEEGRGDDLESDGAMERRGSSKSK